MQTVIETPTFTRQADKLFSEDEKRELIDMLAERRATKSQVQAACANCASRPPGAANAAARV